MKIISKLLASLLTVAASVLPVYAENRDKEYFVANIEVPAWQMWNVAEINDYSYGPYIFMELYDNGNNEDDVRWKGVDADNNEITKTGICTEGAGYQTRVQYTDHNDSEGRWLHGISVSSARFNWGSYFIYGRAVY